MRERHEHGNGLAGLANASLQRRQLLAAGGLCLSSCAASEVPFGRRSDARLDQLLRAHAELLPERAGAGANHYPMAAEALEALGHPEAIDDDWIDGASLYTGTLGRERAIVSENDVVAALGCYGRFGDWLDHFRSALEQEAWQSLVARWAPRLAPGLCAAAYHGVLRSGHATRALRQVDTAARRDELAAGLAYWAARYVELPTLPPDPGQANDLSEVLQQLEHPWIEDRSDVEFSAVLDRLHAHAIPSSGACGVPGRSPQDELAAIVHAAATAFLEMLVLERNRLWLLHTVTGPAALQWLLPEVDRGGADLLLVHARHSVVAMHAAYGEPYRARAHVRSAPPDWPLQIQRAVDSRSVHGIKLIDALVRFDRCDDPLWRSVAAQWFEWT